MTIAIVMRVNDGLVLATDSASVVMLPDENGNDLIYHVYNHADKIFNLKKGKSIACMTWGCGNLADKSISTIAKDFRKEIMSDINEFSIEDIANKFKDYIENIISEDDGDIGFIICGYSSLEKDNDFPKVYEIQFIDGKSDKPKLINEEQPIFINWYGETQYISRLILGFDPNLENILKGYGLNDKNIMKNIKDKLSLPLGVPSMPIQDAIEFIKTLAYVTIQMSKFVPGAQVVAGDIDIAAITKHEKFKWINRKHYYNKELNPNIKCGGLDEF